MCVALLFTLFFFCFFFSSRRRHTRFDCDWSSDVCSSDLLPHLLERHAACSCRTRDRTCQPSPAAAAPCGLPASQQQSTAAGAMLRQVQTTCYACLLDREDHQLNPLRFQSTLNAARMSPSHMGASVVKGQCASEAYVRPGSGSTPVNPGSISCVVDGQGACRRVFGRVAVVADKRL